MPGAREAVDAVRAAGGRAIVVTAKYEPNAEAAPRTPGHRRRRGHRLTCGRRPRRRRCASTARRSTSATTPATCAAPAPRARCPWRSPTGPCDAAELRAAGADVVLADLTEFPAWLERYVAERPGLTRAARRSRERSTPGRGDQEADAHQHAHQVGDGRERVGSEEQRSHRGQGGHGSDDEDDARRPVTSRRRVRRNSLGFVSRHPTRVVPSAERNNPGSSGRLVTGHLGH